jgi:hypothetical protein
MTAPLRMLLAAVVVSACALSPARVFAQPVGEPETVDQTTNPIKPDFKGAVGLGLIGAELGFVVPALAGARDAWVYIVFPLLGAGGGAVAGYFLLEKGEGNPELAVAVLTTGMALAIPALVVTLAATSYEPEAESPRVRREPPRLAQAAAAAGPGLVRWSERGVLLAPPAIGVAETVDAREALRTGVARARTTQVALLSGVF